MIAQSDKSDSVLEPNQIHWPKDNFLNIVSQNIYKLLLPILSSCLDQIKSGPVSFSQPCSNRPAVLKMVKVVMPWFM